MLTLTTANPNNAHDKIISRLLLTPQANGKSPFVATWQDNTHAPSNTSITERDAYYLQLIDDGVNIYDPNLNVNHTYRRYLEKRVATLSDDLNYEHAQRCEAERANFALLMLLLVVIVSIALGAA